MASLKITALGGLDKKSNHLNRAPDKASDMLNMEYDTQSTIKKRNGYDLVNTLSYDDFVYFPSRDETIYFTRGANTVFIVGNGYSRTMTLPINIGSSTSDTISSCENTLSMYFTMTDYSIYVIKYDGSNFYRAGLPTPRQSNDNPVSISGTYDSVLNTRFFYSYKDINGLTTFSPYYETINATINTGRTSTLNFNSLKNDPTCSENGFFNKYCWMDNSISFFIDPTVNSTALPSITGDITRTLPVKRHNYIVGEKFLFDAEVPMIIIGDNAGNWPASRAFVALEIEAVTATSITFKKDTSIQYAIQFAQTSDLGTFWPVNVGKTEWPLDIRTKLHVYDNVFGGTFTERERIVVDNSVITISATVQNLFMAYKDVVINKLEHLPMEDVYDTSTSKIMPPICKYVASYGDQIVFGSVQSFIDFNNKRIQYNNNDLIIYTDILTGDNCENTSEFNRQKVGETYDGEITGLGRCNDSMIVFKNRGVFSLDGVLVQGQYSIRKINSNGAGCTSHKSIVQTDEGLFFQSHNGIYFTNALTSKKITYELDSYFGSSSYNTVRAARYKKKQKTIFYLPSKSQAVIIDYYYGQVYIWDGFNASNGIIENNDGDVLFGEGAHVYKFSDSSYSDNGNAISAYYATTYHHMGEPSLNKKFVSMRLFSLTNDVFSVQVGVQPDWSDTDKKTFNKSFGSSDQTINTVFDMLTAFSARFVFRNSTLNENLVITGYEINYEPYNVRDKN